MLASAAGEISFVSEGPQIKGFALRGLLKYVKESSYPGGIPALLEKLSDEDKQYFSEEVLSSLWYPYPAFSALAQAISREIADGDISILEDVGRTSGGQDLSGIFRFITAILSVERIVSRASAFWRRYCDTGELDVVESGPAHFTVRLSGFPEIDAAHCHMISGWIRGLGDGTGAKDVEIRKTSCVHLGDPHCEYQGSWS